MSLKTNDEILYSKVSLDGSAHQAVIYFLIDRETVVYVGQSLTHITMLGRIKEHSSRIVFDSFAVIYVGPNEDVNALEVDYIIQTQALYNMRIRDERYVSRSAIQSRFSVTFNALPRAIKMGILKPVFKDYFLRSDVEKMFNPKLYEAHV